MSITIKTTGGRVLYVAETATDVRTAVEEAVRARANLRSANLGSANLRSANLRYANLDYANLGYANLDYANLGYANLRYANLDYANLGSANLGSANLGSANLGSANLDYANLGYANLDYANLGYANLGSANLRSANLGYANLAPSHPLFAIRQDFFAVLDAAPAEVPALIGSMDAGKIDGSTYEGDCACLVGTIAKAQDRKYTAVPGLEPDGSRPAEQWFMPIGRGDTPVADLTVEGLTEGVFRVTVAKAWADEWLVSRTAIAKALATV